MNQYLWVKLLAITACAAVILPTQAQQTCPFDDGNSSLAVEGVILTRYALGITGAPLVMSTGINAVDAPMVEAAINCPGCGLNITGNPTMTVADATIISRKLAGFSGDALTNGLALGSGTRNTPAAVQSFLLAGCGATGGTVTSIIAGTGLTGGTISTTGTIAADTAFLQRRVTQSCGAGASISSIDAAGNVDCQIAGAGTVTQVQTGAGLTGGPISGAGTINLASTQLLPTTACATDQIAKWNGSAWVCSAPPPAIPACMIGQVVRTGVGGALQCGNLPNSAVTNRVGTDVIGSYSKLAVGSDGLPVVSYYNTTSTQLYVLKCGNPSCTSGNTNVLADVATNSARFTSVAVPADNLPVISYHDADNSSLKVLKCGNAMCSVGNSIVTVDNSGTVGAYSSIVVPSDGKPVISYRDQTNSTLKVVKCGNAACSNGNAFSVVDTISSHTSIAMGGDGFPVIAYQVWPDNALKFAKCADAGCTVSSTVTVDNTGVSSAEDVSVTVPADGRPLISYFDGINSQLKVARCGNAACNSGNVRVVVDASSPIVGVFSSIAMGADGLAVVSYRDRSNGTLKFVKCGNSTCGTSVNRIISTLDGDNGASVGLYSSIAVPADGLPVISHFDSTNGTLKLVKCSNAACVFP